MRNWVPAQECGRDSPGVKRNKPRRQAAVPEGPEGQAAVPEGPEDQAAVPEGPEGQAAVPVGGGRARAGLEIDHSEPSGSRVAFRAGGPPPTGTHSGPTHQGNPRRRPEIRQATRAAGKQAGHNNAGNQAGPQSAPPQRAERNPYSPRNALIEGISRTACTRPAR